MDKLQCWCSPLNCFYIQSPICGWATTDSRVHVNTVTYRFISQQICRFISQQIFMFISQQIFRFISQQIFRFISKQIFRFISQQIFRFISQQIFRFISQQVFMGVDSIEMTDSGICSLRTLMNMPCQTYNYVHTQMFYWRAYNKHFEWRNIKTNVLINS